MAHKALAVSLLGITLGCGDPMDGTQGEIGAVAPKVVGGWAATTDQIFATVEIRRVGARGGFCSGALISPLLAVTAAHCAVVESESGEVRPAGPGSLEVVAGHLTSRDALPSMMRVVLEVVVHPEYDHQFVMGRSREGAGQGGIGSPNDIALLFLAAPFEDSPNALMLTPDRQKELVGYGDLGFVAGYGVYDLEAESAGELHISDAVIDIIGPKELLTRRTDQLGDSCFGDSGGPLYVPTEEGDFLVGLVSRGRSDVKRDCGDGGVYTLLSAHLPWIAETAGSTFDPRPGVEEMSFLAEGADPIQVPKGGSLRRASACAASPPSLVDRSSVWALASLIGFVVLRRRLSRARA